MEMERSGERDELIWRRERGRSLITETFSTLFLSVSPSIHPSHTLTLCQGSRTVVSEKNKHEGLYVTGTHTHKHKSKQTHRKEFSWWWRNRKWMQKLCMMGKVWNMQSCQGQQVDRHIQLPWFSYRVRKSFFKFCNNIFPMISEKKKWHGAWFYASDIDWIVKVSVLYRNEWGEGLKTRGINDVYE